MPLKSTRPMSPLMYPLSNDRVHHCDFCDEFSSGSRNSFAARYQGKPGSRVLLSTANLRVLPSLGQIVEGHLLIIPTMHFTAMADVSPQIMVELVELCARVRWGLRRAYAPPLLFEHGVRGKQLGGCGIDHAHLHAVPFASSLEPIEELKNRHPLTSLGGISEIPHQIAPDSPYLYYEETNGQAWACEIGFVPSQYLRKCVAESLGTKSWDWRECRREKALIASLERLSRIFDYEPDSIGDLALSGQAKAAIGGPVS